MQSKATSVQQYLRELPADRRDSIEVVRDVIRKNLDRDYEEGMQYGMIGYYVPHRIYPPGYHCDPSQPLPFACLASQKNYMSLYLGCVYGEHELAKWFFKAWARTGKKLDMGKSCIRFRRVDDLALEVIGEVIRRMPLKKYLAYYESVLKTARQRKGRSGAGSSRSRRPKASARPLKKTEAKRPKAATSKAGRSGR